MGTKHDYIAEERTIIRFAIAVPAILGAIGWAFIGGAWGWVGIAALMTIAILMFAAAVGGLRAGDDE